MAFGKDAHGNIRVALEMDSRQAAELREWLGQIPGAMRRVTVLAINDTIRSGRQVIVKGLSEVTTARSSELRKRIRLTKATQDRPYGRIQMRHVKFAATRFKHKEKRRKKGWGTAASGEGVFLQVFKDAAPIRYPHAFLATGERFGPSIFERVTRGPGSERRHLKRIAGIDMGEIFWKSPDLGEKLIDRMREQFAKNLDSKTQFVLSKKRPADS